MTQNRGIPQDEDNNEVFRSLKIWLAEKQSPLVSDTNRGIPLNKDKSQERNSVKINDVL